jgi:lysophospholipase L1-like esterase
MATLSINKKITWEWLLLVISPFYYGIVINIFPINYRTILIIIIIIIILLASIKYIFIKRISPLLMGMVFVILILSSPFWALDMDKNIKNSPQKIAFSFTEAKANPSAFANWWNFFVSEVVRTNKIIYTIDRKGKPDSQGILPYKSIPGAKTFFYKGRIIINNQGYRGKNFSREKGNIFRILTIGDSTTFGQTLFPDSKPWSSVLQQIISTHINCNKPIQVVNGGINRFYLRNAIDRISEDFKWLKPDMVLSYFGWNSMGEMGVFPNNIFIPPSVSLLDLNKFERFKWFLKQAEMSLMNRIIFSVKQILFLEGTKSDNLLISIAKKNSLYKDYLELIKQSNELKYQLVLLSFNTAVASDGSEAAKRFFEGPFPYVRITIKQTELHNQMIRELAKQSRIDFIDTSNNLHGHYSEDKFLDIVHFTTLGDRIMAENVYKKLRYLLLKNKSLSCRLIN